MVPSGDVCMVPSGGVHGAQWRCTRCPVEMYKVPSGDFYLPSGDIYMMPRTHAHNLLPDIVHNP